jgi:NTE family protein
MASTTAATRESTQLDGGRTARTALVLGAGGTVGIAYHAGVLMALADAGIDPAAADLVVGTSAGSVAGAILRSDHDIEDVWTMATENRHMFLDDEQAFRPDVIFRQGWRTPIGLARRVLGAGYVLNRSVLRWPPLQPPLALRRIYRGGLASVTEQRGELAMWTGEEWPEDPLWLCTVDIVTGRRLVLGQPGRPRPPLPDAVRAASAVPGLYPPVRVGRRMLVDGGVHSSTNLDVAVSTGAELIIVAAPLAYDHDDPPPCHLKAARIWFDRALERELAAAEEAGARVLVLRPDAAEARAQGLTFMRTDEHGEAAELARERTAAVLRSPGGRGFARRWKNATSGSARTERAGGA